MSKGSVSTRSMGASSVHSGGGGYKITPTGIRNAIVNQFAAKFSRGTTIEAVLIKNSLQRHKMHT